MVKELVDCTGEYWEYVRLLRNDERVQDGFIQSSNITKEQQDLYMQEYSNHYRICLVDSLPAGYVGVIEDDIRVCTHPDYQNMGVGKYMITEMMKSYPDAFAKVKINNIASLALFKSLGFQEKFIILTK